MDTDKPQHSANLKSSSTFRISSILWLFRSLTYKYLGAVCNMHFGGTHPSHIERSFFELQTIQCFSHNNGEQLIPNHRFGLDSDLWTALP